MAHWLGSGKPNGFLNLAKEVIIIVQYENYGPLENFADTYFRLENIGFMLN